ncbi:MAG: T9SS type A sorting domain-containing protein, partial [Bacteroidetes bacterium]|nr:T9SS type A sorting domain-containing protein [Bacteroidota bacterium]
SIVTPDHIEPIIGKRINEPEIALGIAFDTPQSSVHQSSESPPIVSFGRSLAPENRTLIPKEDRTLISKNFLGTEAQQRRDSDMPQNAPKPKKTLMEILLGATSNPQMVTLVRNGKIAANEWNYMYAEAEPDKLQPVYVSLKGKESAEGIADYALLWLPASVRSPKIENGVSANVSPNPIEKREARISVYAPNEIAVSIAIYDMFGKKIQDAAQAKLLPKGLYNQDFTADIPDGVYVVAVIGANGIRLASGRFVIERTSER